MNAINFIKQHGVDKSREVVEGAPDLAEYYSTIDGEYYRIEINAVNLKQLKRLVESLDLVKSYGGIINAKHDVKHLDLDWDYDTPRVTRLKQAIADYESIYSNDIGDDSHIENHVSPLCHHHWVDGLDGGTLVCAHKCGAWK